MNKKLIQLIKFVILTAIFYTLLASNIFHIADFLAPNTIDYTQREIPESHQETNTTDFETIETGNIIIQTETGHFAASDERDISILCDTIAICDKINFKGNFTDNSKYTYTQNIIKILSFIDNNSSEEKPIEDVINTIDISNENGKRRWYATRDKIIFNVGLVKSQKEFTELWTHEIGHITDLWYIQWSSYKKDNNFTEFGKTVFAVDDVSLWFYKVSRDKETIRKAEAKKKDFCSGYGMSDPFEDFAECFNLYINHNNLFKQIARTNTILKKKYNIIASIFDGQYINASSRDLTLIKNNSSRRPRDTTKIN